LSGAGDISGIQQIAGESGTNFQNKAIYQATFNSVLFSLLYNTDVSLIS